MKSHYCGEITSSNLKEEVIICGWIHRRRDHGGVIFLDVRDIKGICQVVVNPGNEESFKLAESIRNEFVVQISGLVRERLEGTVNENMHTGEIEIDVKKGKKKNISSNESSKDDKSKETLKTNPKKASKQDKIKD